MELLAGFGAGIATQLGQSILTPINRQFGYVVHYKKNMKDLKEELEKLQVKKIRIQEVADEDRNKGCQIVPNVEEWLTKVVTIEQEVQEFFKDEANKNKCLRGRCPNLMTRRSLSIKAKKFSSCVLSLLEEKIEVISYPPPLPKLEPNFIDDIKVKVNMRNLKKFPKLKDLQFRIPVLNLRVNMLI